MTQVQFPCNTAGSWKWLSWDGSKHEIRLSIHDAARGGGGKKTETKKRPYFKNFAKIFTKASHVISLCNAMSMKIRNNCCSPCEGYVPLKAKQVREKKKKKMENQKHHASGNHKRTQVHECKLVNYKTDIMVDRLGYASFLPSNTHSIIWFRNRLVGNWSVTYTGVQVGSCMKNRL